MPAIQLLERQPGLWRLKARVSRKDIYRHVRGDEAAAKAGAAAWRDELDAHGAAPAQPGTPLAGWLAQLDALDTHLQPRTRDRYAEVIRLHILPRFGKRAISRIGTGDVQAWMRELLAAKVGVPTVREAFRQLRAALERAAELRVLPVNPIAAVRPPRRPDGEQDLERRVLQPKQFPAARAAGGEGTAGLVARLGLASGARRGELLALTWAHLDLDAGKVRIEQALEQRNGCAVRVKATKNKRSRRTITLPIETLVELRRWRARQAPAALAAGLRLETLPVFPAADAIDAWWSPRAASRAVGRALRRIGLDCTLHGLRHAHATVLLSRGVNPRAVQARLGHTRVETTLGIYGHALPEDDAAATAVMDDALRGTA